MRTLPYDVITFFVNHVVNHIPFWSIRKLLYVLCGMNIGCNARILMNSVVYCPWKITIGNNSIINEECIIDGRGGLIIGHDVSISMRTIILTGTHDVNSENFAYKCENVIVGNNVWTGAGSIILPGTVLEDKAVLAAGSVAKKGRYARGVYSGIPAQYIKERTINSEYELGVWKPWLR